MLLYYFYIYFSFIISYTSLVCVYFYFRTNDNLYYNSRILSFTNAIFTSIIGLYRYKDYYYNSKCLLREYSCNGNLIDKFAAVFFIVYLCLDLIFGTLFYRKAMGLITGYIHHTLFILIVIWTYIYDLLKCSSLIYILEIPTIFLSAKFIFKEYKRTLNLFFFVFFTLTRVILQSILTLQLIYDYIFYNDRTKKYFIPIMFSMLILHIHWFKQFINKYII